ncbi:MAG: hypothetical protein WBI29_01495 [Candidatus Saccharimonadales bacterium]|jgi:hypothetical protein
MKPEAKLPEVVRPDIDPNSYKIEKGDYSKVDKTPEINGIETAAERQEQVAEMQAVASDLSFQGLQVPTPITDDNTNVGISQNAPLIASDDDLIEKEWVDKAKKIVAETQNDPYSREDKVSKLRVDYIKKRWGRDLGATE